MLLAQNTQHCVITALITTVRTTMTAANITLCQKQYHSHYSFKIIKPLQYTLFQIDEVKFTLYVPTKKSKQTFMV